MREIHVVGAAIISGSKVLVAQRSSKMKEPLKWEFAGGKVEEGETHQEALRREIHEELGVKIEVQEYLATGSSVFENKKIQLHVYKAALVEGEPLAKEHERIEWVDISTIMELDWAQADLPACEVLVKR